MRNWRTSIIGAVVGGLVAVQPVVESGVVDIQNVMLGFFITAFGIFAKDFNVSGK